jgi:hypothetical protein
MPMKNAEEKKQTVLKYEEKFFGYKYTKEANRLSPYLPATPSSDGSYPFSKRGLYDPR